MLSSQAYDYSKEDETDDISIRTDHRPYPFRDIYDFRWHYAVPMRARGYVLRRLMRRAARHGKNAWYRRAHSSAKLSRTVIEGSKDGYPELEEKKDFIFKVLAQEEEEV